MITNYFIERVYNLNKVSLPCVALDANRPSAVWESCPSWHSLQDASWSPFHSFSPTPNSSRRSVRLRPSRMLKTQERWSSTCSSPSPSQPCWLLAAVAASNASSTDASRWCTVASCSPSGSLWSSSAVLPLVLLFSLEKLLRNNATTSLQDSRSTSVPLMVVLIFQVFKTLELRSRKLLSTPPATLNQI